MYKIVVVDKQKLLEFNMQFHSQVTKYQVSNMSITFLNNSKEPLKFEIKNTGPFTLAPTN